MKKVLIASIAILMSIGIVAFTRAPSKEAKPQLTSYHYTGTSTVLGDVQNIENWTENSSPSCPNGEVLPCRIDFDGDMEAFESYLQQFSSVAAITAVADEKKSN